MEDKPRILIVDDDIDLASNITDVLKKGGYAVAVVHSGGDALEACADGGFILAVSDISLPDISGIELAGRMAKVAPGLETVIITGTASIDMPADAVNQRCVVACVTKPLDTGKLLVLLERLVGRKQKEMALKANEQSYAMILDNASDLIQSVGADGKFIYVNRKWLEVTGYTQEEAMSLYASDVICPEDMPHCMQVFERVFKGECIEGVDTVFVAKDGSRVLLEGNVSPRFENGHVVSTVGVLRDVTERNRMKDEIHRRNLELEAQKEELLVNIEELTRSRLYNEALLNSMADGLIVANIDGAVIDANKALLQMMEIERGDLVGLNVVHLLETWTDLASAQTVLLEWKQLWDGGGSTMMEMPVTTASGKKIVVSAYHNIVTDECENPVNVLAVIRDITERKRAEDQLKESESLFRSVTETASDAIITTDRDGKIIVANRATEDIFGYISEELTGKEIIDIMPDAFSGTFREEMSILISRATDRAGKTIEATGVRKDGSRFPVEFSRSIWSSDKRFFFTGIVRDITSRREMENKLDQYWAELEKNLAELQEAYEKLKELDKMKDSFLSTVSHELRTPLTSIKSFAEILINYEEDRETQKEFLGIINDESDRLTRLINDFLDLAKIESGRMQWQTTELGMGEVVEAAVNATHALATEKKIGLQTEVTEKLPLVLADKDRLTQVVTNLLSNAIKFTPEGGHIKVNVGSVSTEGAEPNLVKVSVADTGIGISVEDMPQVFEKFKQVGDTLRDKPQGTGLGLPICREIVQHYGGDIWVESELGKGSTFIFTLPVVATGGDHVGGETTPQKASAGLKKGSTILVVEDEENIRRFLSHELAGRGFKVIEASGGKEAISLAREHVPDLITLDVLMPGLTGFDVAAVLRNDAETRDIPILIVSVLEDKDKARQLGVNDYLTKPFEIDVLIEKVNQLLEKPQKSVLVVDDDRALVKSIRYELQKRGFEVCAAYDGRQALEIIEVTPPDIILLDIVMPEVDGYEVIRQLKGGPLASEIPIVLMTGMEIDGGRVQALSLGATEYFTKSGDLKKLFKAIEDILGVGAGEIHSDN